MRWMLTTTTLLLSIAGSMHAEESPQTRLVSFCHEVIPILTKYGCATGACHGSPGGKGSFRLSLRGFDPQLDEITLIREEFGRRTNSAHPEASLLLRKPTMATAHGGGRRMRPDDPGYRILKNWIAQGCRPDPASPTECVGISVRPVRNANSTDGNAADKSESDSVTLAWPNQIQKLEVSATYADGSIRDVTHLADLSSSHQDVATVDPVGLVTCHERGEATILVRYLDKVATVDVTLLRDVEGFEWSPPPIHNFIDELVFSKLKKLQIATSEMTNDSEFLRRVYLDTLGTLPSPDEARSFLQASKDAVSKVEVRRKLIGELLERQEYAEFQALQWADLLRLKGSKYGISGVHKFHQWLVRSIADNIPYDQFARSLLTATGSTFDNPPSAFFRAASNPNSLAETTSQLFLGIRIQCARCHNHPFERWTQDHYYGMGAFFSRVRIDDGPAAGEKIVWQADSGEVTHPRTNAPAALTLPLSGTIDVEARESRPVAFAEWLTSDSNPFFARMAVNRLWGRFFGRGIVEPIDDFRDSNPPAHPELLDRLAAEFISSGYDTRHIVRLILESRVYQLTSRSNRFNESDERYFSHGYARLLRAEQLLDAITQVTGVDEQFAGLPPGTRATQLPSPDVGSDFLKTFGQSARNTACECERNSEPKLTHALNLISGELLTRKLNDGRSRLSRVVNNLKSRLKRAGDPPSANLRLWLRADRGVVGTDSGPPGDGLPVSEWIDHSVLKHSVTQTDPSARPVFISRAIGGLPALRFDGQNDLLHNTQSNILESSNPRTVMIIARAAEKGGSLLTFRRSTRGPAGRKTVFTIQHVLHNGTVYVYSDGVNSSGNSTVPTESHRIVERPFLTTFVSEGTGSKLSVRLNGKPLAVSQPGGVGVDNGADGFTIGAREDYPGFRWDGDIAEVLVYEGVLSKTDLTQAGSYLATKYGIKTAWPDRPVPADSKSGGPSNADVITELYLSAFSRFPTAEETAALTAHVQRAADRRKGLEDVYWAVLNSKEFVFQH